jgi:hypothetical protein
VTLWESYSLLFSSLSRLSSTCPVIDLPCEMPAEWSFCYRAAASHRRGAARVARRRWQSGYGRFM